jgi:hypothetical protein
MDKKSKELIIFFFALLLISAAFTYYRTMIERDFPVTETALEE